MDEMDRPREACGVVGLYTWPEAGVDVARSAFFALYALQHRGQESAGIAASDGRTARVHRGMGLVSQVFNEENLSPLQGHLAIGHTRYSTTGASALQNAQPYLIDTLHGPLGLGHNGNLTNATALRQQLLERGVGLMSSSDSEVLTQLLASPPPGPPSRGPDWERRIQAMMARAEGAYSVVILTRDAVYAARDPVGLRPLCVGLLRDDTGQGLGYVVASESCALLTIGAKYLREVHPGEIVRLDRDGLHSVPGAPPRARSASCIFEYVYFARPDSLLDDQNVHAARQRLGAQLAREAPADADLVISVPDSSTPAAIGYARESGIPYVEGLIKNRYIGRTFIQPSDRLRRAGVRLKYNALRANLEGKRVVLVDDSIVRGNTMGPLIRLVREGGRAAEVHVRVSSPPVRHPCFMGVDMSTHGELIAHRMDVEAIRAHVGADSLAYLSLEGMHAAVREGLQPDPEATCAAGHCDACFSGCYPVDVSHLLSAASPAKSRFERGGR
ncbi:MAG: amidophosphoribosyltransferase [Alphaproteobacteria bacterium]|nr:amidophosphoribosyltransferase [Alphaproteobacteria bacterium]